MLQRCLLMAMIWCLLALVISNRYAHFLVTFMWVNNALLLWVQFSGKSQNG